MNKNAKIAIIFIFTFILIVSLSLIVKYYSGVAEATPDNIKIIIKSLFYILLNIINIVISCLFVISVIIALTSIIKNKILLQSHGYL